MVKPRMAVAPALVLVTAVFLMATGVGASHEQEVTSYTGCLKNGKLEQIAPGDRPSSKCVPPATEVHFSGGDITAVLAGVGLQGGAIQGDALVELAPGYRLPQSCSGGEIVEAGASGTWVCGTDDLGPAYTAGTGLALSGNEFSIDRLHQLPQDCAPGGSPEFVVIGTTGVTDWACHPKADADQACPTGQFATGFGTNGSLVCAAGSTSSGGLAVYRDDPPSAGIPDDFVARDYASVEVPSGTYLVIGNGYVFSEGNFEESNDYARCRLSLNGVDFGLPAEVQDNGGEIDAAFLSWTDTTVVSGNGTISIRCVADFGADGASIESPSLIAVRVS